MMREYDINRLYGMSLADYDKLFKDQHGRCAICNTHVNELSSKRKKNLCVDHCHETGEIRGLLCDSCNRGIGLFKDNPNILNKASLYLSKLQTERTSSKN